MSERCDCCTGVLPERGAEQDILLLPAPTRVRTKDQTAFVVCRRPECQAIYVDLDDSERYMLFIAGRARSLQLDEGVLVPSIVVEAAFFDSIDRALKAHDKLEHGPARRSAEFRVQRDWVEAHIEVQLKGKESTLFRISGGGDTPSAATTSLISSFDIWAETLQPPKRGPRRTK